MASTPPVKHLNRAPADAPPRAGSPILSVVVISERDLACLERAIARLLPVCRELSVRVLVVRAAQASLPDPAWLAELGIELIQAPAGFSTPELRSLGMARSRGDVVTLVEDHQAEGRDWADILLRRSGTVAGPIPDGLLNR